VAASHIILETVLRERPHDTDTDLFWSCQVWVLCW